MTDRYAVIGHPIEHSLSPWIHQQFASLTGEDIAYDRLLGSLDDFAGDVARFIEAGGKGLNVTVPFKERAFALAERCSARAKQAGAANTLIVDADGRLRGDNTDGIGLVRDLRDNHGFEFEGRDVLLVGAGGAARGVLHSLLEAGPERLHIANRTPAKATALAGIAASPRVSGGGLAELEGQRFDLVINATAAGLRGEVPMLPDKLLASGAWTYDLMYGHEPTAFQRWGSEHGASKALDGLGMLVEQAAESFFLWRGKRPPTVPVIERLIE